MDYTDLPLTDCKDGTEAEMLCFALDRVRVQFAWKTGGLDAEQLRRPLPPSTMTLAGLIKHMASVEDGFTAAANGRSPGPPWDAVDWATDVVPRPETGRPPERWDWHSATTDEPKALYALWYGAVERSRSAWQEMIDDGGFDAPVPGDDKSRRRVLIDLLEEYLKHTGHADLLREAVDGVVGNDPW